MEDGTKADVNMSFSITSGNVDEVESNIDRYLSDAAVDDESKLAAESFSKNSKPTLLCAEKIWKFPVSSEF